MANSTYTKCRYSLKLFQINICILSLLWDFYNNWCLLDICVYGYVGLIFRKEPDLELEGLLKRHYTTVEFFQGTMMNAVDLERVKVPRESCLYSTWTVLTTGFLFSDTLSHSFCTSFLFSNCLRLWCIVW